MDRRKSIKSILLGSVASGMVIQGCAPDLKTIDETAKKKSFADTDFGRTPEEKEIIRKLEAEQFFNPHEMEVLGILCALILPANDNFGSATDAGAPDFIEFMVKDYPPFQTPIRGGLMWLEHKSNTDYSTGFKLISEAQQKEILDVIAFPNIELPESEWPLEERFFATLKNLTLTGYFTSKMGIEDLGYKGNQPNVWDGVPEEVLAQHNKKYDPEWIAKCIDQSKRADIAVWDDQGNLLT